jgi:hypothetical protein
MALDNSDGGFRMGFRSHCLLQVRAVTDGTIRRSQLALLWHFVPLCSGPRLAHHARLEHQSTLV